MLIKKRKQESRRSWTGEDIKRLRNESSRSRRMRRFEADDDGQKDVEVPPQFAKKQSYTAFVDKLIEGVDDEKAKAWIDYAFGDSSGDIKFTAEAEKGYAVQDLYPTQNFIGLENSIGFTVNNPDKAGSSFKKMLMEKNPEVKVGSAIWIFEGKYIIDGHHRWSQVYAFNPNAKITAVNFKCSEKLDPKQALAAVQGVIASVMGKVPVSTSKIDGQEKKASNVLKDSDTTMIKAAKECLESSPAHDEFNKLCDEILESGEGASSRISRIDAQFDKNSSGAKILTYAVNNCLELKAGNQAVHGAPDREKMPQTDGGKGAPKDIPGKVKSVLSTGIDDVIKNVEERRSIPKAIRKRYM